MLTDSLSSKDASGYFGYAVQSSPRPNPALASEGQSSIEPVRTALRPLWHVRDAGCTVQISPAASVKRRSAAWSGMRVEIVQATQREKLQCYSRSGSHLLVFYEQGTRVEGETTIEGLPRSMLREFRHKLTFVPAGHEYREWHGLRAPARTIYIHIDPASMPAHSRVTGILTPRLFFENAALRETAFKLAASIEAGRESDVGYLEALGNVLVHELAHLDQGGASRPAQARGGLAGWQQRVIAAYIDENVDQTIPLSKLAELARLSTYYFCRAFKESFGLPPHRYHTSRRIDRAKALLASGSQSVTEIGLSLGFSETSSFTAAFRKTTGTTPTAYRRSLA